MEEDNLYNLSKKMDEIRCNIKTDHVLSSDTKLSLIKTIDRMQILLMEIWNAKGYGLFKQLPISEMDLDAYKWRDDYEMHTELELKFLVDDLRSKKSTIISFSDSTFFDSLYDFYYGLLEAWGVKMDLLEIRLRNSQANNKKNSSNNTGCIIALLIQITGSISFLTVLFLIV